MELAAPIKKAAIDKYKTHEGDTGSPEVQVALLTERVNHLAEHLRFHRKDHAMPGRAATVASAGDPDPGPRWR